MNYLQKKKLAFMSIVNRVKGFVRTVTGVLPLTLTNCVDEKSIICFNVFGQDEGVGEYEGTTGKYKIPITVSGKNVFDKTIDDYVSGEVVGSGRKIVFTLKPNTTYTLSSNVTQNSDGGANIWFNGTNSGLNGVWYGRSRSATTNDDGNLYVLIRAGKQNYIFEECWLQIEEGLKATDYEPYHEPIITSIYLDEPLYGGECIKVKNIPTFKGTSIITADTTIQPSNAEIIYYSSLKE